MKWEGFRKEASGLSWRVDFHDIGAAQTLKKLEGVPQEENIPGQGTWDRELGTGTWGRSHKTGWFGSSHPVSGCDRSTPTSSMDRGRLRLLVENR